MDSDPDLSQDIEEEGENERWESYGYILLVKERIESFTSVILDPTTSWSIGMMLAFSNVKSYG